LEVVVSWGASLLVVREAVPGEPIVVDSLLGFPVVSISSRVVSWEGQQ
jgi:hypothetical protein